MDTALIIKQKENL